MKSASEQIDDIIRLHGGWKNQTLSRIRAVIRTAYPHITEEVKWKTPSRPEGLPVWSHGGILCYAEIWKDNVKLLFAKGAHMHDHQQFFNARLQSIDLRAIEYHESDPIDETALILLIDQAIQLNDAQ